MAGPQINDFQVQTEDVAGTATSVRSTVQEVESEIAALRSFVERTSEYWQGRDQVAFATLMQSFQSNATSLTTALDEIAAGLHGTAKNYDEAGHQNTVAMQDIHQNLPPARF